jgi:ATP-binding cassette subfamily B protein
MNLARRWFGEWPALRRFAPDVLEHRGRMGAALCLSLAVAAVQIAMPWPMQWLVDGALVRPTSLERSPEFYVVSAAAALFALVVVQAVCEYAAALLSAGVAQRVARSIRLRLFEHLAQLSPRFFARHKSGDLLVRILGDVALLRSALVETSTELAARALWIVGSVAVMLWVDALLTAMLLAVLPLVAWTVRRMSRRIETQARKARRKEGSLADFLQESLAASAVIQSLGRAPAVVRRLARESRASERAGQKSARLSAKLASSVHTLLGLGVALALCAGGLRVLQGHLSPGELLVFVSYVRGLLMPVRAAARNTERVAKGAACAARIAEVLDEPVAVQSRPGAPLAPLQPRVLAFEDVHLSYDDERDALRGFSQVFERGELVGVFGPSGAGKSTLAALAVRLFDPDRGAVTLDGVDLRQLDLISLRERFGLSLQSPVLLGETLRHNLELGNPDADDAALWNALTAAGAAEFVRALPGGLDAALGAAGVGLSGGEARRIALARTLLRDAPIVIADEPFTGLDRAAALHVLATLRRQAAHRIVLVIAHEQEFLDEYGRVVVLDRGRAVAAGLHAELLARDARYREVLAADREVPA